MSILAEAFHAPAAASTSNSALNDFWYTRDPSGFLYEVGSSGLAIGPDTILKCGTVLAAVRFRADLWAMLPPTTFKLTRGGREPDPTHHSQRVLRQPNVWQTGNRWRHLNGVWLATWGNGYNEIIAGPTSFADELRPLHPREMRIVDQRSDGSLVYLHKPAKGPERRLGAERILHFREFGTDGIQGLETFRLIRNAVGIAMLAERHQSTFLRKGARISGLLVPEKPLEPAQRKLLKESVNEDLGGANMTGALGILPSGVKLEQLTMDHRTAQLIELDDRAVNRILMTLGVPGVVVGWQGDKTSTYASAEAYFEKGGIRHTALPILTNIEAEEEKALLIEGDGRQIKHNVDALMRGSFKDRIEALAKAAGGPIYSRNEARELENLNRLPGEEFDTLLTPVNMDDGEEEPPPEPPPAEPPQPPPPQDDPAEDDDEAAAARAREVDELEAQLRAERSRREVQGRLMAERVIRRETKAALDKARAFAADPMAWEQWVRGYYARHVAHTIEALGCTEQSARVHCELQVAALLRHGAGAVEAWKGEATARLAAVAGENGGESRC